MTLTMGQPTCGVMGFTGDDFVNRMANRLEIPPDPNLVVATRATIFGDVMFIGYSKLVGLEGGAVHHGVIQTTPNGRIEQRRQRHMAY